MTLYEYLTMCEDGAEVTVWDDVYDIEMYFYNDKPEDEWQTAMLELSKLLTIQVIRSAFRSNGVLVNLTELVERHIDELKKADLFINCDIDSIMCDMPNIISGYVSEEWLTEFVAVLKK